MSMSPLDYGRPRALYFNSCPEFSLSQGSVADPGSFGNPRSLMLHNEARRVREVLQAEVSGARYRHGPSQGKGSQGHGGRDSPVGA